MTISFAEDRVVISRRLVSTSRDKNLYVLNVVAKGGGARLGPAISPLSRTIFEQVNI